MFKSEDGDSVAVLRGKNDFAYARRWSFAANRGINVRQLAIDLAGARGGFGRGLCLRPSPIF